MNSNSVEFVHAMPCTEEDMLDVARELIRINPSRQYYLNHIEYLQHLTSVLFDHLAHLDAKAANNLPPS